MSILTRDRPILLNPEGSAPRTVADLLPELPKPGTCVLIQNLDWKTYQKISEFFTERPAFSLAYDRGTLEIMASSRLHEKLGMLLARIIQILCVEFGFTYSSDGSTTLNRETLDKGIEPDHCFYITNEERMRERDAIDLAVDPPPDLGVEIDISGSSINRLGIYAAIRIPEAWRFDGAKLEVRQLNPEGKYVLAPASMYFPTIPLEEIAAVLLRRTKKDEESLMMEFRAWVREQMAKNDSGPAT